MRANRYIDFDFDCHTFQAKYEGGEKCLIECIWLLNYEEEVTSVVSQKVLDAAERAAYAQWRDEQIDRCGYAEEAFLFDRAEARAMRDATIL